jgi:hypothetical protein
MNTEDNNKMKTRSAKKWVDELSWYLLVMGFITILLAGLCFFLFRNRPLTYADFSIDANALGKYLMIAGLLAYVAGRIIHYTRKFRKN